MPLTRTESEQLIRRESEHLSKEPAPINLHLYQPPRELNIQLGNRAFNVFNITGRTSNFAGFNQLITNESYQPLSEEGILGNQLVDWDLYGVTADWMSIYRPDLLSRIQETVQKADHLPVGDPYIHVILPFLSNPHKKLLLNIGQEVYREHYGASPETIWLPESAVDQATLDCLVDVGYKGVLLREHQVHSHNGGTNMYKLQTENGDITAVVGHNTLSGVIGFDKPWADKYYQHWRGISQNLGYTPRVSIDGETIGHWWKKSNGAFEFMKYLLKYINDDGSGSNSKVGTADLVENTSWSCLDNGLGRWTGSEHCSCGLSGNHLEVQTVRQAKADLFNKLQLATTRIDEALDTYCPSWREGYIQWFMSQRLNLASGTPVSADKFTDDKNLQTLFISAYLRDIGWTSCGWFFGDLNGFERQVPRNSLFALAEILNWPDIIPSY